ncbi:MAG: DUF3078 domain-containing protein [Prevotellaceae bacterium]|jgi:hypothetical protein|nr:DUF3078 domain-containing protein [Prevotellaceae bacterium]
MRTGILSTIILLSPSVFMHGRNQLIAQRHDTVPVPSHLSADTRQTHQEKILSLDSLLSEFAVDSIETGKQSYPAPTAQATQQDSIHPQPLFIYPSEDIQSPDISVLKGNPFFIDLVYMGLPLDFGWLDNSDNFLHLLYGFEKGGMNEWKYIHPDKRTPNQFIYDLREDTRRAITTRNAGLYATTFDKLPNVDNITKYRVETPDIQASDIVPKRRFSFNDKLKIAAIKQKTWRWQVNTLFQISGNTISSNWHKGGNSNLSTLITIGGKLHYDNKENIQWENSGEWKMGIYSTFNDETVLRKYNFNDDILELNSKFGFKAGGNWYYSALAKFSTQFFKNYKSVTEDVLKTALLAPVKFDFSIGMDYKYKKIVSIMFAPISYRHIYVREKDGVDPNQFGIETGKNKLSELGSSINSQLTYSPIKDINIDSKLSFYTNYSKVVIDLEIVCNFTINRFTSTRLMFNPRYDNTVIYKDDQKAKIQYRSLLSVGFSHRFH